MYIYYINNDMYIYFLVFTKYPLCIRVSEYGGKTV